MSTNVKPGDVAMVKAPYAEPGRGAVVQVLRASRTAECIDGKSYFCEAVGWVVEGWVRDHGGTLQGPRLAIADECLRPLRWSNGEDEVLRIAGKPQEIVRDLTRQVEQLRAAMRRAAEGF
ncbi:hypothetical protein [Azohydromonas aeria]|uniref:hypothetical protein n=1 Tax=Azohydromonas aeria TaxID=2590212 RepID=UPI0012F7E7BF|nr:hypothetical protein [Azohydromonas aeria]